MLWSSETRSAWDRSPCGPLSSLALPGIAIPLVPQIVECGQAGGFYLLERSMWDFGFDARHAISANSSFSP